MRAKQVRTLRDTSQKTFNSFPAVPSGLMCHTYVVELFLQDHLHKQPWCQTAAPDEEKLAEAFRQHKSLDFFDYVTYDAFKVHPHLLGDVSS